MIKGRQSAVSLAQYHAALAAFFAAFSLFFLALVNMRRGFLLPLSSYLKIGSPSGILYLHPAPLALLVAGGLGAWLAYRYMNKLEKALRESGASLAAKSQCLALGMTLFFVADLFIYRGVPATRIAAAGKMGLGQAIPLTVFPWWLRPLGEGINYFALVWHATLLAILIGGLVLLVLGPFLKGLAGKGGFRAHLAGTALALPQPFCSCCSAPIGSMLYRGGASLGATLAFVVSSPMLNVTALTLAVLLLPTPFALTRVLGGVLVGIFLTYAVCRATSGWDALKPGREIRPGGLGRLITRLVHWYASLFHLESFLKEKSIDSPVGLITNWLGMSWRLARLVVPVLFLGAVATAAIVAALPSPRNDFVGVIIAAAFGTMLMVPTWTEIPLAAGLINQGLYGPAAALLLTLPAVSIPCLVVIAGAISNWRAAAMLGFSVFVLGLLSGLAFL